jgi:histidinol-phosphate aminotransferase
MSERTAESVSLLVRSEVRAEKPYLVKGARDVAVKLNQNESPFDLPGRIKRELLQSFFQIPFNRYPREQPFSLVSALSRIENHPEDGILVGNGSNELTHSLGLSFVSPGARVVLPRPMFALYESVVRMHGGTVVAVAPLANLHFDTESLIARIREHSPVMTVLTTPNNPTGKSMTIDEIRLVCLASEGVVVVDEAYHEFNREKSAATLFSDFPNLIVMRTLSKAFGLAGVRIGYMLGNPTLIREIFKSRLPFMVDRFSEMTALAVLKNQDLVRDHVSTLVRSVDSLYERLEKLDGVSVVSSQTNFLLFRTDVDPGVLAGRLSDRGILVRNMSGYPELIGYLRVTAGTEAENNAFVEALKLVLEEL